MADMNHFYKATEEDINWFNTCREKNVYIPLQDIKSIINNIEYLLI